jgi:predicted enzyme related to lactoylglutathione lyase
MPRPIHFEISADEPTRAVKFYQDVFGWKIEKWNGPLEYWMVMTGEQNQPGIDGGLMRREKTFPPTTNTIDVPSVDDFIAKILKSGGKVVRPKMPVPTVGWMAYCEDTEGNIFGIIQMDKDAK